MKIVPIRSMPSPNRVGSCLWKMIIILIRGHNKEYFLQESHCKYRNSLLCTVFYEYINKIYNVQLAKKLNEDKRNAIHAELITHGQHELCTLPLIACQETGYDIYSYFRKHFFNHFSIKPIGLETPGGSELPGSSLEWFLKKINGLCQQQGFIII